MSSVSVAYALYLGSKRAGQKVIVSLPNDSTLGALSEAVWKQREEELKPWKAFHLVVLEERPSQQLLDSIAQSGTIEFIGVRIG